MEKQNAEGVEQQNGKDDDPLLVLASMRCTYIELVNLLVALNFAEQRHSGKTREAKTKREKKFWSSSSAAVTADSTATNVDTAIEKLVLPIELVHQVAQFLTVKRVIKSEIRTVLASSTDNMYNLSAAILDDDGGSWWLSGDNTMPNGHGSEFVQVRLCPQKDVLRRITAISVSIPPLPFGPLSVKTFCVEALIVGSWKRISPTYTVENRSGFQRFELASPGIDANDIRFVCLSNQISSSLNGSNIRFPGRMESVGFYCIAFD